MSSWEKVKGLSTEKNAKGVSPNNESLVSKIIFQNNNQQ